MTERVDVAVTEQIGEAFALLFGESGCLGIGGGVLEVDGIVSDVEVSAPDDGFLFLKSLEILSKLGLPLDSMLEADKASSRVRNV